MEKLKELQHLIDSANRRFGYAPSSPSEFTDLIVDIKQRTGRTISMSTIKRIWGYIDYANFPSTTTLNILAQYIGHKDWNTYLLTGSSEPVDEDSGFIDGTIVDATKIREGEKLRLRWSVGKSCDIECIAPMRFRVNKARNIKLAEGDTFTFRSISLGLPIFISDILRGDTLIPAYIGAKKGGLTLIERL